MSRRLLEEAMGRMFEAQNRDTGERIQRDAQKAAQTLHPTASIWNSIQMMRLHEREANNKKNSAAKRKAHAQAAAAYNEYRNSTTPDHPDGDDNLSRAAHLATITAHTTK